MRGSNNSGDLKAFSVTPAQLPQHTGSNRSHTPDSDNKSTRDLNRASRSRLSHVGPTVSTGLCESVPLGGGRSSMSFAAAMSTRSNASDSERGRSAFRLIRSSRCIVEHRAFVTLTTFLTLYALAGDDIRLILTDLPADNIFNGLTIACIFFFTLEMILSSIGKTGYIFGFFFWLDFVATATLVMDLTWVYEEIQGDEDEMENVRGSRTAKIGARFGRIVKLARLIRIVKLYKAVHDSRKSVRGNDMDYGMPGSEFQGSADSNFLDADDQAEGRTVDASQGQSRVGKKLSDLTIRRIIVLVLLMIIVLPLMRIDASEKFAPSAFYGADVVLQGFHKMLERASDADDFRLIYERALLQYIYYHNWFGRNSDDCPFNRQCPMDYSSHLFWFGIEAKSEDILIQKVQAAQLRESTIRNFSAQVALRESSEGGAWIYNYGPIAPRAQENLGTFVACDTRNGKYFRRGISMLSGELTDWGVTYEVNCPEDLRRVERHKYSPRLNIRVNEYEQWHFAFFFDKRPYTVMEAWFSLGITFFVCAALCSTALLLSNDATRLAVYPLERMIVKVDMIRKDPLKAIKMADNAFKKEVSQHLEAQQTQEKLDSWRGTYGRAGGLVAYFKSGCQSVQQTALLETAILEKTIMKLGSLLALGFGEAGSHLIASQMQGTGSLFDGKRVECIIGSTRICDFGIATEVLQVKIMTFVNQVAEIVHGVVDEFNGAVNRNDGDMFLLIWTTSEMDTEQRRQLANMAMLAATRIFGAVHRSPILGEYRGHPGLMQRQVERVNVSTGLHYGWAIQGAVGSEFKIDASYLSPNVSIAESIENLAETIYNVPIILTESLKMMLSSAMTSNCRLIDRVIIPGSAQPMELYAVDLDYTRLRVDHSRLSQECELVLGSEKWNLRHRFRARQFLEHEKKMKWADDFCENYWEDSVDIGILRASYTLEFKHVFSMGYQNYLLGEWDVAKGLLSKTRDMLDGIRDGPSVALLRYMELHDFKEKEWQSGKARYRDLHNSDLLSPK